MSPSAQAIRDELTRHGLLQDTDERTVVEFCQAAALSAIAAHLNPSAGSDGSACPLKGTR